MSKIVALVLALVLFAAPAFALNLAFPLPLKHSELAKSVQNIDARPGPICNPTRNEFAARFDGAGYHWLEIASVDDDGSAVFLLVRYQPGADEPEVVYKGHSPAKDNDVLVIDSAQPFEKVKTFGSPCDYLFAPQA